MHASPQRGPTRSSTLGKDHCRRPLPHRRKRVLPRRPHPRQLLLRRRHRLHRNCLFGRRKNLQNQVRFPAPDFCLQNSGGPQQAAGLLRGRGAGTVAGELPRDAEGGRRGVQPGRQQAAAVQRGEADEH